MNLIPFKAEHLSSLQELHASQGFNQPHLIELKNLPAIGYLAELDGVILAAGFLRMIEGNLAMFDTLVSNGSLSSELRHIGLSAVTDSLIQLAKDTNLRGILAFTADKGILKRAEVAGFKVVDQTFITLDLENR